MRESELKTKYSKEIKKRDKLIAAQKEYIEFLIKASEAPIQMAWVHGWRCSQEDIDKGNELRNKIKKYNR